MALAVRIVDSMGGVGAIARAGLGELMQLSGVGVSKACRLAAAIELGRRVDSTSPLMESVITSAQDAFELLHPRIGKLEEEMFVTMALDSRNRIIAQTSATIRSPVACPVVPADAFRFLIREAAVATIFAHNHPSDDVLPSDADQRLTEQLVLAGTLVGIRVLDHVIVGRNGFFSFADARLI